MLLSWGHKRNVRTHSGEQSAMPSIEITKLSHLEVNFCVCLHTVTSDHDPYAIIRSTRSNMGDLSPSYDHTVPLFYLRT